jgi:hypothetical protein
MTQRTERSGITDVRPCGKNGFRPNNYLYHGPVGIPELRHDTPRALTDDDGVLTSWRDRPNPPGRYPGICQSLQGSIGLELVNGD